MADDEEPEDEPEPDIPDDEDDTGTVEGSKSPTVSKTPSAGTKSDQSKSGSVVKSSSSITSPSTITDEEVAEGLEDKLSKSQEELSKSDDISLNGKKTSLDQLSTDRVQKGKKMYRQCHRRFREIIGKRELKNEELEKQTGDLQERLNILECSMPAVMVWNIWRMTQGAASTKPPCLKRVLEKQFEGPASGEVYCPSTPSRHFDCRVREVEAERKQALKRVEEARTLWAEKIATLEDRNKRLEEAKRIQEETKEKIQQLTAESQRLKDALPKEPEEGECEAGECGVTECKKKWLEKVPSNASIKTADIECLQRLQELAEKELAMKRQITDLERREEAYMRTLQQADELWCKLEGDAASTMSALQEQLDLKTAANLKMADRICELEDVIEKLMERLSTCRGELEKYMSVTKIEALIGRDDDFAEILDKEVSACAEWKERMIGMDGDLVGVRERGLMAKAQVGDAQMGIHPEDFAYEDERLREAADYLARLGSLSELDKCDDDFICDFSCNDVVLTETGLTDEEMKALEENRVTARMLMEKTGMDVEAELAKVRESLEEEKVSIKTEAAAEVEEETDAVKEELEETEEEFEEAEMGEEELEEDEEVSEDAEELGEVQEEEGEKHVFDEEVEDEGAVAEEVEDEGAVAEEVKDEVAAAEDMEAKAAEDIEAATYEMAPEEAAPDEKPELIPPEDIKVEAEEVFEEEKGAIVTEIVDVATEPGAIVADENNILVQRDEMMAWKDGVDLIRSTVAQCSNCVIVKKDADELATKLAMLTGTEMTEIPEAVVKTSDEAEVPEDEAKIVAEEELPDTPEIDQIKEEQVEETEVETEELAEEAEEVEGEEIKLEGAPAEDEGEEAFDEELLPPEETEQELKEEEDEVISVKIEEKEEIIPVEVLSEEEVVEPKKVEEKREEEEEEEPERKEREELDEKKEVPVPPKVRDSQESISEEEIICVCEPSTAKPPTPVPKPTRKVEITQTEITRIETIQVITQTTEDIATQTLPAPAILRQTHSPQIITTTRTLDADSEMIERILTPRRPPADQMTTISITESSQRFTTTSFPIRTREAPLPGSSRRTDVVQKSGPEREIRSILYSRRSEDMEEDKCNCCLCAETTSSMFDVSKSKKETQKSDIFFKFLSTLPTLKRTCCQSVDKQQDTVKSQCPLQKPFKKATRDQDMCTCGPPLLKGQKLQIMIQKCDQSCMAKIPKIKPERVPKKKQCVKKDVDFDEVQCPCTAVIETGVPGVEKKMHCACGD